MTVSSYYFNVEVTINHASCNSWMFLFLTERSVERAVIFYDTA